MTDLENLEERIARLERLVEERHYIPSDKPWYVPLQPKVKWPNTCSKCGLKLDTAMCYSCVNIDCPCGMGPVSC